MHLWRRNQDFQSTGSLPRCPGEPGLGQAHSCLAQHCCLSNWSLFSGLVDCPLPCPLSVCCLLLEVCFFPRHRCILSDQFTARTGLRADAQLCLAFSERLLPGIPLVSTQLFRSSSPWPALLSHFVLPISYTRNWKIFFFVPTGKVLRAFSHKT